MTGQLSKGAVEFLTQDMLEAERALNGLDAQIEALKARREGLTRKIELIKAELGPVKKGSNGSSEPSEQKALNGIEVHTDDQEKRSFRDYIRLALRNAERGMRPKDVKDAIRGMGYPYEGIRDPTLRTQRELYRMARLGQVKKRGKLYYATRESAN